MWLLETWQWLLYVTFPWTCSDLGLARCVGEGSSEQGWGLGYGSCHGVEVMGLELCIGRAGGPHWHRLDRRGKNWWKEKDWFHLGFFTYLFLPRLRQDEESWLSLYQPVVKMLCWDCISQVCCQVMCVCVPSFLGVGRVQWADWETDFTKHSSTTFQEELPSAWLILFLYSSVPHDKIIASPMGYEIFLLSFLPKKTPHAFPGVNSPCFNSLPLPLSLSRFSITAQLHFYCSWMLILLTLANPCPPSSWGTSLKWIIPLEGDEKCSLIARLASS